MPNKAGGEAPLDQGADSAHIDGAVEVLGHESTAHRDAAHACGLGEQSLQARWFAFGHHPDQSDFAAIGHRGIN
ncbi:hypothetical protein GCM10011494_39580 [Novosphingobium endophyticum]|uniref:Uncharacterized protein n=1 Tax=Novosphingobium endophyticum TaxID=1955250 RepID=A0A916X7F6_9SPHN|nr:hypothetical protein GCM10011494_39580 [Novosphingobium endophyticum]